MTSIPTTGAVPTSGTVSGRRILSIARLHFVNRLQIIYLPLMILGFILLINIAIWAIVLSSIPSASGRIQAQHGFSNTGAVFFLFVYALVIAVQAMSRTFAFSLGFGVTRRDFYLGSVVAFVLLAAGFSLVLTVLSIVEKATNGWGLGGRMFVPNYFDAASSGRQFLAYFLTMLFCLFVGAAVASVFVRWKTTGIVAFFALLTVVIVAAIGLLTLNHGWPAFGAWLSHAGVIGLTLWSLIPSAIAAVAGFFILRRATPKS
jgi:hypothetical protein